MKNNKGFSLVELIIVIAIMAVLVGVLAPTYLQYVEKSKKANDVSTIDTIVNAVEIAAIDPVVVGAANTDETITITVTSGGMAITPNTGKWVETINDAVSDAKLKSFDSVSFTATKSKDTGKVVFSYVDANTDDDFEDYATSLSKIS